MTITMIMYCYFTILGFDNRSVSDLFYRQQKSDPEINEPTLFGLPGKFMFLLCKRYCALEKKANLGLLQVMTH